MKSKADTSTGFIELLRENCDFRNLMMSRFISQAGDWFNFVALSTLLLNLTGSGEAVALVLIIKLLPTFFFGPLAGVVADRFNRKTIMMVTDVLRGILGFGFLFIQRADQVWIAYALSAVQIILSTFFEPAESAAVPNIVRREDLVSANALSSATWSITLALGAAAGGIVTDLFGRNTAFIIDALSFFLSAFFVLITRVPPTPKKANLESKLSFAEATGINDLVEGARYLKANPRVVSVMWIKSGWGVAGGGVLFLLAIFGKEVFPIGADGSTSIGILYGCRGFGALIGPMIARAITSASIPTMRRSITVAFFISTFFYLLFATSPFFALTCLCVIGGHAGGSIQWVFSTTLLQFSTDNRFLGRVFALEQSLMTLTLSTSTYLTAKGMDSFGYHPKPLASMLGFAFIIPGIIWWVIQRRLDRADAHKLEPSQPVIETGD
ncbi:MAG: MFS transporter [Acidobacteriota bacterium]